MPDRISVENANEGKFRLGIDAQQIAALLEIGHTLFSQGRLNDAEKIFEGLAILDSRNPYVHRILGAIHQKQKRYDIAIGRYSIALKIFPDDVNSLTNRGEIYLHLGMLKDAVADFKAAIELDPNRKHPAANRARMMVSLTREVLNLRESP